MQVNLQRPNRCFSRYILLVCLVGMLFSGMAYGERKLPERPPGQILQADESSTDVRVTRLRCEYLENPLGIDMQRPRLSWIINSNQPLQRQTAYQILVSSGKELLEQKKGDLWNSGKIASEKSINIPYSGKSLKSGTQCFWKVRIWDKDGKISQFSEPAYWTMGLLSPNDWKARWIAMDKQNGDCEFPQLRKTFVLTDTPSEAAVYVNALGYYELFINGEKVDDHVLSPAVSQYTHRSFYLTHEVTKYLKKGKNCIALWLGQGWYSMGLPGVEHDGPVVRAQLELKIGSDKKITIGTDTTWKCLPSPISRIGKWRANHFGGECYDARKEIRDWNKAEFDDSQWNNVINVNIHEHTVCAQMVQPNRIIKTIKPKDIKACGENSWLIDFGTNLTGWFDIRLPLKTKAGQKVVFQYFDRIEGRQMSGFSQKDEYICRGSGNERFCSRFNYHGFRYVIISGLENPPPKNSFSAYLIATDFSPASSFSCSNDLLNNVHDMIAYTLRCLSLGGYIVDCPHIERLGYGGDGQASTETALMMYGMGPLYKGWLAHWRDCQRPDGSMPHTAPNPYRAGGGPYWCGFIIPASWYAYVQYGDIQFLEENYCAMQKWLGFVESHCKDDILDKWPDTDYRTWYLGDWAVPKGTDQNHWPSIQLTNNCFRIYCYDLMTKIAMVLDKTDDAKQYKAKVDSLRPVVHKKFYDPGNVTYADGDQLDLAFPLLVGAVPENQKSRILKKLEYDILVKSKGHLGVGLVGLPILIKQLMAANQNDLIFTFVNTDTYPGWGYMLKNGATTTWEEWDSKRSHIHNCYNAIGVWFYNGLAGIRPDPDSSGFKHFVIRPAIVGDLTWVKAKYISMYGPIESNWKINKNQLVLKVTVPTNTSSTVYVPATDANMVKAYCKQSEEKILPTLKQLQGNRYVVFKVQSGEYTFTTPLKQNQYK